MHGFDSGDEDSSGPKGLETQHRFCHSFDGPVVLLDNVVQVFVLAHQDVDAGVGLYAFNGRSIGTALVDGDLLGYAVQVDGALQKAPRRSPGIVPLSLGRRYVKSSIA